MTHEDMKLRSHSWEEKHYHQIYDLGGDGYYIEADRIDRPDTLKTIIKVFAKGKSILEKISIYNIKYDYHRGICKKRNNIIYDILTNGGTYGHLLMEDDVPPEKDSIYPFAYEPVNDAGSEMFRKEGFHGFVEIPELQLSFMMHQYKEETYENWNLWGTEPNVIVNNVKHYGRGFYDLTIHDKCDPIKERQERLDFFKEQAEYLLIPEVPIDYRFVD